MIDYKLHIPGPVDVSAEAYQAMSTRVMGHRSPDFVDLYNSCQKDQFKRGLSCTPYLFAKKHPSLDLAATNEFFSFGFCIPLCKSTFILT